MDQKSELFWPLTKLGINIKIITGASYFWIYGWIEKDFRYMIQVKHTVKFCKICSQQSINLIELLNSTLVNKIITSKNYFNPQQVTT